MPNHFGSALSTFVWCWLLLPVCLVPMLAAAALLKVAKGRAFCTEGRFGKNGEQFSIYRLNSPRAGTGLPGYERLFQRLSITELPQLFNVLRGDMSLVGPRPEGFDRARRYTEWNRQRLRVKPGITGLAQVYGLRDQHSSEDKTRYDLAIHPSSLTIPRYLPVTPNSMDPQSANVPQTESGCFFGGCTGGNRGPCRSGEFGSCS